MLFFDDTQLALMRESFAASRWPDFHEPFLLQPAPPTLQGGYGVLRWDGSAFTRARPTDAKFASWVITENSVAFALSNDRRYLESATQWATAALNTQLWQPQFAGNLDLFYGNLLYALAMFLDLCSDHIPLELRDRFISTLHDRSQIALKWFTERPPHEQRYTQNHFYIPMTGLLCAAIALKNDDPAATKWIDTLRVYPPLIFDALGRDGYFFEGPDYFHYAFIWLVRLAELCERHLDLRVAHLPCFTKLKHFLRWMYFPKGGNVFAIGDASAKEWNFSKWSEHESGQTLMSDNRLQNFSHVLYWIAWRNGDDESRALADEIKSRSDGFHWYEGFWSSAFPCRRDACVASSPKTGDAGVAATGKAGASSHFFNDYGIWCADSTHEGHNLRILAKCGPPLGHSMPMQNGTPAYAYDAGHCHPDAGTVLATIDDVPILLGPGYLGRKSGAYLNTLTFDGRGQQDDRIYHALNASAIDYSKLLKLSIEPLNNRSLMMSFADAYADFLGVKQVARKVELTDSLGFSVHDDVELKIPRRPEARFRISDPPTEITKDFVRWKVAPYNFEMRVAECSTDFEIFVTPGEVISINDDGRPGPFEAGTVNQRGYQIIVRPREKQIAYRAQFEFTAAG